MARRKSPQPDEVAAALSPDGRQICPKCFSRPSVTSRSSLSAGEGRQTKPWEADATAARTVVRGQSVRVGALRYPCSNAACFTVVTTRFALGVIGREAIEPVTPVLHPQDAQRYTLGKTGKDGVWRGPGAPDPAAPPRPAVPATKRPRKRAARK
jgi:hypothetical protein